MRASFFAVSLVLKNWMDKLTPSDVLWYSNTTDGGANFKAAGEMCCGDGHITCIAHTLSRQCGRAVEDVLSIELVEKVL